VERGAVIRCGTTDFRLEYETPHYAAFRVKTSFGIPIAQGLTEMEHMYLKGYQFLCMQPWVEGEVLVIFLKAQHG
jgi:hypothetical protein